LLNVGKSEGSQVIQLFGRGVRLHGKGNCLKRSGAVDANPPLYLKLVETLNIFSIKAAYLEQFRRFLETDGIIIEPSQKVNDTLLIRPSNPTNEQSNYKLRQKQFSNEIIVKALLDPQIHIELDLSPRVEIFSSDESIKLNKNSKFEPKPPQLIPMDYYSLFNWDQIFFALLDFREQKSWYNLVFTKSDLQEIMKNNSFYTLLCPTEYITPKFVSDFRILQDIVIKLLKKYLNAYYQAQKQLWIENKK